LAWTAEGTSSVERRITVKELRISLLLYGFKTEK
jgi:hypothetical protein